MPPPGPAAPGDSDFARAAFFEGIGAVGFAYGAPRPAPLARRPTLLEQASGLVERMRWAVTAKILAQLPGSRGAIASAIITGRTRRHRPRRRGGLARRRPGSCAGHRRLPYGASGGGSFLAGPRPLGAGSFARPQLPHQEMGSPIGAFGRRLLSGDQRGRIIVGARLRNAGHDAFGGAVRPAGFVDAQPGAGGGNSASGAARSGDRAGLSNVLRGGGAA